jgi:hypothetical protein
MLNDFDPVHLYWLLPLAGAVLGVGFALFWELPITVEVPIPLKYTMALFLLSLVWCVGLPQYVKYGVGESAQGGFIRGGEHYVYDYDWFKRDGDDESTRYHRVSAGRWWWLLFAEVSLMHLMLVLAGFLVTQGVREGIKRGVKALRGERAFGVGGGGSGVQDFPDEPTNRARSPGSPPIPRWLGAPVRWPRLLRYAVAAILTFWLWGWALGWYGAAREIARGGPLLQQLFLLGWLGVWTVAGLANLWMLWALLRPARKRSE